jgi:hypothetical protein
MKRKGKTDMTMVIALVAVLGLAGIAGYIVLNPPLEGGGGGLPIYTETTGTMSFRATDQQSDSETVVYPTLTVIDEDGDKVVDDTGSNSTTVNKEVSYDVYGTGTTYYCDAVSGAVLAQNKGVTTVDIDCQ